MKILGGFFLNKRRDKKKTHTPWEAAVLLFFVCAPVFFSHFHRPGKNKKDGQHPGGPVYSSTSFTYQGKWKRSRVYAYVYWFLYLCLYFVGWFSLKKLMSVWTLAMFSNFGLSGSFVSFHAILINNWNRYSRFVHFVFGFFFQNWHTSLSFSLGIVTINRTARVFHICFVF